MRLLLSICTILFLTSFDSNSDNEHRTESTTMIHSRTKFDAVISVIDYGETNPVSIFYKVYPYGGSGNYIYKWRVYGTSYGESGGDTYELVFPCIENQEEQFCKVYCEVTDVVANQKFTAELRHHVIPCYTSNY